MASFKAKIKDPVGLHARPASITVSTASKFTSDIVIKAHGKEGNLKSIMNVMALGVRCNDEIEIAATGVDEEQAVAEIEKTMKDSKLI